MRFLLYFILWANMCFSSCKDGFTNEFFEELFRTKGINITQICSNSPSLFSEGKFIEVYTMRRVNKNSVMNNIFDEGIKPDPTYRYKNAKWHKTPSTLEINTFVKSQLTNEDPGCFNEDSLLELLSKNDNYYSLIEQRIGPSILLIWDIGGEKLYMLSSEDL